MCASSSMRRTCIQGCIRELKQRGCVAATTHGSYALEKHLNSPRVFYAGFEPTSDSLHVGNLAVLMTMRRLQERGHTPICLIGGATGLIGDPSGRDSERTLLSEDTVRANASAITEVAKRFLHFDGANACRVLNNMDWLGNMSAISFLRDVGKHFRVRHMLSKDSVRTRLNVDSGLSLTEFSYQCLQGYDFLHLQRQHDCSVQLGGNDQWGNITAGIHLISHVRGVETFGLTVPLLTTSNGAKFGKSAGNAVWLSADKTSPYELFQYLLKTDDKDIPHLLNVLSPLSSYAIVDLLQQHASAPHERKAHEALAHSVTSLVHGRSSADLALESSKVMFGGSMDGMASEKVVEICRSAGVPQLSLDKLDQTPIVELAVKASLCASKGAVSLVGQPSIALTAPWQERRGD